MKRIIKTALMAAVAALISVTVCQTTKAQGDKVGLEKTANAFLEAVKAKDTAKLRTYYTDDYTYIGADGKIMSAEERLKALAAADAMVIDSFSEIETGVLTGMNSGKTSSGAAEQDRFTQTCEPRVQDCPLIYVLMWRARADYVHKLTSGIHLRRPRAPLNKLRVLRTCLQAH